MTERLTDSQWREYQEQGFTRLGRTLTAADLQALDHRIDAVMMGTAPVQYKKIMMQLDSMQGRRQGSKQTKGHKGATLEYRKIQGLEYDALFLTYMQKPLFRDICERVYGERTPIACYRAMFMNKPAQGGTFLNWHQDRWPHLSADPLVTVWTALDPATVANGCVEIIPGSHRRIINPDAPSSALTEEHVDQHVRTAETLHIELEAGEAVLLHNWTLHSSAVNHTDIARRAFSVCYMPSDTVSTKEDDTGFNEVFGPRAHR
jgi:hypothetical protein